MRKTWRSVLLGVSVFGLLGAVTCVGGGGLTPAALAPAGAFVPSPSLERQLAGAGLIGQSMIIEDWSDADFAVVDPQATPKTITITVRVVESPDFFLLVSPLSLDVFPGSPANFTFTIQPVAGYDKVTHLAVTSALPTGWTASFSTVDVAAGGSSTLTITTPANAALGPVPFEVTATEIF